MKAALMAEQPELRGGAPRAPKRVTSPKRAVRMSTFANLPDGVEVRSVP